MKQFITYILAAVLFSAATSCQRDDVLIDIVQTQVTEPVMTDVFGFYLLNEGNMGSNKASLDYFDATTGIYNRNIYAARNPEVVMDLGDVGNNIMIYGNKMYAVINCSHKVEVLTPDSARRVAQIDIPNCRYALGYDGNLYVSSYVGMAQIDPTAPRGAVFKVDTASLTVTGSVEVGYQPEEMAIIGNRLYVANSGGYHVPDYDNTVSVIDLRTFTVADDPDFKRKGNDLYTDINIDLYTAVLGGEVTIHTLDGQVKLKVRPGTQNGAKVRLKGKGFPVYKEEGAFGDLIVTYHVSIPTNLTDKQKDLFRQLQQG